jgi:hypothetical protein
MLRINPLYSAVPAKIDVPVLTTSAPLALDLGPYCQILLCVRLTTVRHVEIDRIRTDGAEVNALCQVAHLRSSKPMSIVLLRQDQSCAHAALKLMLSCEMHC